MPNCYGINNFIEIKRKLDVYEHKAKKEKNKIAKRERKKASRIF